jgi:hypothetical protein
MQEALEFLQVPALFLIPNALNQHTKIGGFALL